MFGKSVLSFLLLFSFSAFGAQLGTVVADETFVYLEADFDAKVIATAKRGETFQMGNKPIGPFYRVRLKNKRLGWISSLDIKSGKIDTQADMKKEKEEFDQPLESHSSEEKARNTYAVQRFHGFFIQSMDWKEKTLNKVRKDNLQFFGWNWTGFDTLIEGPFYLDSRIMATFEAPAYYKKVTGVDTTGWIIKAQTSFVSANPLGENGLFHYGMGVVSTFSHFETGVLVSGSKVGYTVEDLGVGVVIPLGVSYRFGPISTQAFYHYYFEKINHSGVSLGLNWRF